MSTIKWSIICALMSVGFALHAYALDYSCSEDCSEQCLPGDIPCIVGCEVYKEDYCNGQELCGPEQAIPNEQIIGVCDTACQQGAPVKAGSQTLDVCMNYSGPVTALVGIMTQDFSAVQWLADDCSFSDNFQIAMDGSQYLECSNVPFSEAFRQGWVFWLVSPSSLAELDWQSGNYELLFNQIPEGCPSGEVEIQGQCVSCSDDCTDLFPGDIPATVLCAAWQDKYCMSILCSTNLPDPVVSFVEKESWTDSNGNAWVRYRLTVENRHEYPDSLFSPAPDLPPCMIDTNSPRTWVDILDQDGKGIITYCSIRFAENLGGLEFSVRAGTDPPSGVRVVLNDRLCEKEYRSELVEIPTDESDCPTNLPDPVVSFVGKQNYRYFLTVVNRHEYPDSLFSPSPDLPPPPSFLVPIPSFRTLVSILDQDDKGIIRYCSIGSTDDLGGLEFSVRAGTDPPSGVRVVLNDRLCEKEYRSELVEITPVILYSTTCSTGGSGIPNTLITVDYNTGTQNALGTTGQTQEQYSLDRDPVSGLLFGVNGSGTLFKIHPKTGVTSVAFTIPSSVSAIAFSPTGQLYALSQGTLGVINLSNGNFTENGDIPGHIVSIVFSPQGTLYAIAASGSPNSLLTLDPATATILTNKSIMGNYTVGDIAYGPDNYIYGTNYSWALLKIDPATGDTKNIGFGNLGALCGLSFGGEDLFLSPPYDTGSSSSAAPPMSSGSGDTSPSQ